MPQVIALIRVSSEEQAAEGRAGMLRQQEDIHVACQRYNLTVTRTVELVGVSGSAVLECSEIMDMLSDLALPQIDGIVLSAQDRLARPDTLGGLAVYDPFARYHKKIWTPAGVIDVAEDSGFLLAGITSMMAGLERRAIVRRTQTAKEEQRKRGRHANAKITLPHYVDFDFTTGIWSWKQPEADRIKYAFSEVVNGRTIRDVALEIGYTARGLGVALRNPIVIGIRRYELKRGEKYPAKNGRQVDRKKIKRDTPLEVRIDIETLITRDLWDRAQDILSGKTEAWRRGRSTGPRFLCSGLAVCGNCGKLIYSKTDLRKGKHDYYFCSSRSAGTDCGAGSVWREVLDGDLIKIVSRKLADRDQVRRIIAGSASTRSVIRSESKLIRAEAAAEKARKAKSRLLDLATTGAFSKEEISSKAAKIDADLQAALRQIDEITAAAATPADRDDAAETISLACEGFDLLPVDDQRRILRVVVETIIVKHKKIVYLSLTSSLYRVQ